MKKQTMALLVTTGLVLSTLGVTLVSANQMGHGWMNHNFNSFSNVFHFRGFNDFDPFFNFRSFSINGPGFTFHERGFFVNPWW